MARVFSVIIGGTFLFLAAPVYAQSDDNVTGRVDQCRELVDAEARLACYDRIGETAVEGRDDPDRMPDARRQRRIRNMVCLQMIRVCPRRPTPVSRCL